MLLAIDVGNTNIVLGVMIAPETKLFEHVDVELTLQGLRIVWERNQTASPV